MNLIKKISVIAMALAMAMMFTFGSTVSIFAADTDQVAWDVQKSKTATALDANNQTKVTLSLPSAEYNSKADVVFVLDKSTSGDVQIAKDAAKAMVADLAKKNNVDIKIGVVVFNYETHMNLALTKLDAGSVKTIDDAIDNGAGHGSNTQGGLLKAEEMLSADGEVSNSNKYVVYVTDGIGYVWGKDGHATSSAYQYGNSTTSVGSPSTSSLQERMKAGYTEPSFDKVYKDDAAETAASKFDRSYTYGETYQANDCIPYAETKTTCSSVERAIYLSAHTYADLASKYNCITLWHTHGLERPEFRVAQEYMKWTGTLANSKEYCLDGNAEGVAAGAFDSLENKLVYALSSGTVTDTITDYFDLVQSDVPFTLTVSGKELTGTRTGDNEYSFGTRDNKGVYPYVVKLTGKTFVWTINVPIEKAAPVQLSYKLQLKDLTKSGTFATNVSALLNATDSNGNITAKDDPFQVPTVTYTATTNGGTTVNPTNNNTNNNGGTSGKASNNSSNGSASGNATNAGSNGPKTGDNNDIGLWVILGAVSIALAGTLITLRRRTE